MSYYILEALALINLVLLLIFGFAFRRVVVRQLKLKTKLNILCKRFTKMDCDELLEQITTLDSGVPTPEVKEEPRVVNGEGDDRYRARLAALVASGQLQKCCGNTFKGKTITTELIDSMSKKDVGELYARYEGKLGGLMTRALGQNIISLYVKLASAFLPIPTENGELLKADLSCDPFLEQTLTSCCCELYYRYGMYLAPLSTALTTARYCRWELNKSPEDNIREPESDDRCERDSSSS